MGVQSTRVNLYKPDYLEEGLDWYPRINSNFDVLDAALSFRVVQGETTLSAFTNVLADTSVYGAFPIYLPASPVIGAVIRIRDRVGSFSAANLTINPNGKKIEGSTDSLVLDEDGQSVTLVYSGHEQGWRLESSAIDGGTW